MNITKLDRDPLDFFLHGIDKVEGGFWSYFSVLFFPLAPLENFLPTPLKTTFNFILE